LVDAEAQRIDGGSHLGLIPDLRDIPLAQLAAVGADVVTGVVSRIADDKDPSSVPAMMFNSAI
jgi:FXSXX-COOH protein